jgi:hypothetical protein
MYISRLCTIEVSKTLVSLTQAHLYYDCFRRATFEFAYRDPRALVSQDFSIQREQLW